MEGAYDLVLAAGTWAEPSRIDELWAGAKRIVACDGALQRCLRMGRSPDVVVGDMDSVEPDALAAFAASGAEVVMLDEQNSNDLAKALDWRRFEDGHSVRIKRPLPSVSSTLR